MGMAVTSAPRMQTKSEPPSPYRLIVIDDDRRYGTLKFTLVVEGFAVRLYANASNSLRKRACRISTA